MGVTDKKKLKFLAKNKQISEWKRLSPVEDDDDDDMHKENEDPTGAESFNSFLSLRKQLRKSIFKREEVNILVFCLYVSN